MPPPPRSDAASSGTAIAVDDAEMIRDARFMSAATGICAIPEGGACLSALRHLRNNGWVRPDETVVLFNTGSGLQKAAVAFASCVTA